MTTRTAAVEAMRGDGSAEYEERACMYEKRTSEKEGLSRLFPDARYLQVATFRSDREVENMNIYTGPGEKKIQEYYRVVAGYSRQAGRQEA